MTKQFAKAAFVLALGLLSACKGDSSSPTEPRVNPFTSPSTSTPSPQTFELGPGEKTILEGTQVEVTFVRVLKDDRCPFEAYCAPHQMGGVEVEIQVRQPSGTSTHMVYLDGLRPDPPTVVGSWSFTVDHVLPMRSDHRVTPQHEYRATFTATPR